MAAPPPGADVQDGKGPTAAGLAVIGRGPPGSLPCKTMRGNHVFPTASSAPGQVTPGEPASGRTPIFTGYRRRRAVRLEHGQFLADRARTAGLYRLCQIADRRADLR